MLNNRILKFATRIFAVNLIICGVLTSCNVLSPPAKKVQVLVFRRTQVSSPENAIYDKGAPLAVPLALLSEDGVLQELPEYPVFALETQILNNRSPLAYSPDGRYVLYVGTGMDFNRDIYRADWDGNNAVNLTDHPAADVLPVWSPDGQYIAFASGRDTCGPDYTFAIETGSPDCMAGNARLYIMRADGNAVQNLPLPRSGVRYMSWSSNGQALVVSVGGASVASDSLATVYVITLDRQTVFELVDLSVMPDSIDVFDNPTAYWIPGDQYIHFTAMSRDYLIRPDGTGVRRLILSPDLPTYRQSNPAWSSDGKYAAMFYKDLGLVVLDVEENTVTILGYPALFVSYHQNLIWSPTDNQIIFQGYSGNKYDIYSVEIESRELINLTANSPESFTLLKEWITIRQ